MKYKLQMLDKDPIRQPVELGIALKDIVPPVEPGTPGTPGSPGCCSSCDGWGVLVDGIPQTGDVIYFPDAATTIEVALLGTLCEGECIDWELRQLSAETDPGQAADFTMSTASGCDSVTLVGAGSVTYAGLWMALYPTINGKPFCEPIIFRRYDPCVTILNFTVNALRGVDSGTDGSQFNSNGQIPTSGEANTVPEIINTPDLCPTDIVIFNITQTAGNPGNGEAIQTQVPTNSWDLIFTSIVDLTGAVYDIFPNVNGVDHPEFTLTFSWNGALDTPLP